MFTKDCVYGESGLPSQVDSKEFFLIILRDLCFLKQRKTTPILPLSQVRTLDFTQQKEGKWAGVCLALLLFNNFFDYC